MARKFAQYLLPNADKLKNKRGLAILGIWMEKHPHLFSFQRKRIALGFSIGMGIGVIPIPIQIVLSLFACYFFKANIPATILASFIVNPLTYPLILALILQIGAMIYSVDFYSINFPSFSLLFNNPHLWWSETHIILQQVGILILIGTPITGLLFSSVSYWLIRLGWYFSVVLQWKKRHKNKNNISSEEFLSTDSIE